MRIFLHHSALVASLVVLAVIQTSTALSLNPSTKNEHSQTITRKIFLQKASVTFGLALLPSSPSLAAEDIVLPSKDVVSKTFETIRYELSDPNGGVAYMQQKIDENNFPALMEFTKTYDQELRKLRIGKAKKLLQSKETKEEATKYANAVTFDLIGINRNSRIGQESTEGANKYLQELRDDVEKFLLLETSIETEG
eukprot:scaffold22575_cov141-Cylindrotheca_fusiformis.AAC.3